MSDTAKDLIHVYFMPGMAANPSIFEFIKFPEDRFEVHWLQWLIPIKKESIKEYSLRIIENIHHKNIVLIGVSFGGVIVQEIAKYIKVRRLIIISSIKCRDELPKNMKFASKTGVYKLLPIGLMDYVDQLEKIAVNDYLKKRAKLYKQYLSVRDKYYLSWAIENMVNWDCSTVNPEIIHIHGNKDVVFPIKYIKDAILVEGGTHVMIINRFRWFNKYLPELILKGKEAIKNNPKIIKI
ncbi:alpha/beta hydrolase [Zunongwangia sp. HRR-M8]|uniref:alpha/beta hydrolase n=1 Tax=Zunongwangia sp. HRR-M8 TaxID=3015170 RepID=UPI0022DE1988|nr:alpha/beta hydrolase [Zunongwangia sp. HRR-M8]WBL20962.1 alpha/beta hydrolase [Zunongwangia sp. HRR-M8]